MVGSILIIIEQLLNCHFPLAGHIFIIGEFCYNIHSSSVSYCSQVRGENGTVLVHMLFIKNCTVFDLCVVKMDLNKTDVQGTQCKFQRTAENLSHGDETIQCRFNSGATTLLFSNQLTPSASVYSLVLIESVAQRQ